jgi:hypothetical protein
VGSSFPRLWKICAPSFPCIIEEIISYLSSWSANQVESSQLRPRHASERNHSFNFKPFRRQYVCAHPLQPASHSRPRVPTTGKRRSQDARSIATCELGMGRREFLNLPPMTNELPMGRGDDVY